MEHYGILGLLPPLITIVLALLSKDVILSLFLGIFSGTLILAGGNPIIAIMKLTDGIANSLADGWNIRILLFCALLGALIGLLAKTGAALARGQSKQDYRTPPEFLQEVIRRFGKITLDAAADADGDAACKWKTRKTPSPPASRWPPSCWSTASIRTKSAAMRLGRAARSWQAVGWSCSAWLWHGGPRYAWRRRAGRRGPWKLKPGISAT